MRVVIALILFFLPAAGTQCFADEEPVRQQIQQWVQQLGHESFLIRQRAESLLIRMGIQTYPELQRAKQNPDVEITQRAEYILSQIEQASLNTENREAASWIQLYMLDANPAFRARIIWVLADPNLDLAKGEGLQTLCRLARFEENSALRLEAAKSLIASPPISLTARQRWFQYIRNNIHGADENEPLQRATEYAKLWCELDSTDERKTPEFQERVRQVSAETLRLLERPENRIQSGSKIDILLYYAVAELQDAVGLTADRDKTVSLALAIEPGPIQTAESLQPIGLEDGLPMNEHYHTGLYLKYRFRIHWAINHFRKVIESEHSDVTLRIEASRLAVGAALYLADYALAIAFIDKHIEIFSAPDTARNDVEIAIALAQRQRAYCTAKQAAEADNWGGVREAVMQAWTVALPKNRDIAGDSTDMDLLIIAHQLCMQLPDVGHEFKEKMNAQHAKTWNNIVADYENATFDLRQIKTVSTFNTAAWLLANTDGDYSSALTLVEAALKVEPDDIAIQDTLAHVYFLGGKIEEAIRIQEQVVRLAPEVVIFQRALERFKQAR